MTFLSPREAALMAAEATILDARGRAMWSLGHIPGSVPLHWRQLTANPRKLRDGLLTDDLGTIRQVLRGAGVSQRKPVIIVDRGLSGFGEAGRLFWTLDYFSHPAVYILDGGLKRWPGSLKRALRVPAVSRGDFEPMPRPERRALLAEVEAAQGDEDVVIWDTRTPEEYLGATPYLESRGGHIPGAISLDYKNLLDVEGNRKQSAALDALLARIGATPDKRVILVCSGGVRSAAAYAVLRSLGRRNVANYDGSMWEWSRHPSLPIQTGPGQPLLTAAEE